MDWSHLIRLELENHDDPSPRTLRIDGAISRSCMCVKLVAWNRRRVESYFNEIHTPSPTVTIWFTSARLWEWIWNVACSSQKDNGDVDILYCLPSG